MGTITLTNLPQFIEIPGRNITKTVGALDKMTVPFMGPYYAAIPFAEGSPDTVYPLMFCTGWSEKRDGALKELTLNYAGRTDVLTGSFVSEALISYSASEKELSYNELSTSASYIQLYQPGSVAGYSGQFVQHTVSTINYVLRYISKQVTFKYCSYPNAYVMPAGTGEQAPSVTSQYVRYTGASAGTTSLGPPDYSLYPGPFGYDGPFTREVNYKADQAIGGWYECSVTYDARYEQ